MAALLSIEDALGEILARVRPLPAEPVALTSALGRVLAADVRALADLPPFASSAMDGFAVRAADVPGTLSVVERIAAGAVATRPLAPGEAMGIATGAPVPEGSDAVVPVEYVVSRENLVEIRSPVDMGAHVRPRGGDLRAGDTVLEAGTRLGAPQIGAAAAAGAGEVACAVRPRAAVVSTGAELRRPGESLGMGEIYDSNGFMLAAALASAGATVLPLASVVDDEDAHRAALERGLDADVLVTSGGVSVGPHDLVRRIEAGLGVEEVFWRVAVKPGKPISFGTRGSTLVFGLPGNPVSSLVCFELFVRPAVLALQGARDPAPVFGLGELAASVARNAERDQLLRARLLVDGGRVVLEPLRGQESHMIARAAAANALALVPRGDGALDAGAAVRYLPLS